MSRTTIARRPGRTARNARQASANERRNRYIGLASRVARHQPPAPTPATTPATAPAPEPVTAPEPVAVGASVEHMTTVTGAGEAWHASCSCGQWATAKPYKRDSGAKGAATKHRNQAQAAHTA